MTKRQARSGRNLSDRHRGTNRNFPLRGCKLSQGSCANLLQWTLLNLSHLEQIDLHHVYGIQQKPSDPWRDLEPVVVNLVTKIGREGIERYVVALGEVHQILMEYVSPNDPQPAGLGYSLLI